MNIALVPVAHIDQVWPQVAAGLHDACLRTGGDITGGDLWQQCRNGSAFLIIAHDEENIAGASLWRPETWATGNKLRCLSLYGHRMKDWLHEMEMAVRALAKDCGAASLITEGREGWGRIFPNARRVRVLYEETL